LTGEELADGEVSDDVVTTPNLVSSFRIYWWAWLAKGLARASSMTAMVDGEGAGCLLTISDHSELGRARLHLYDHLVKL
jgi:hypothetical protein